MLETTGGKLHLSCISTEGSVELVRRNKARGVQVSVGIRVANLCMNDEKLLSFDSNLKVNPPLRSQEHIDNCLEAVDDGTIDVISAGHQPRSMEKKMQEFLGALGRSFFAEIPPEQSRMSSSGDGGVLSGDFRRTKVECMSENGQKIKCTLSRVEND